MREQQLGDSVRLLQVWITGEDERVDAKIGVFLDPRRNGRAITHQRGAGTATHQAELEDFDIAYGYLGMARAHAILGNKGDAEKYLALAEAAGNAIADEEDRAIFTGDLTGGNWYGLR